MGVKLRIQLRNTGAGSQNGVCVFRAGEFITGQILISNTGQQIEIDSLTVTLGAQESVKWKEESCFWTPCFTYEVETTYQDGGNFLEEDIQLLGESVLPIGDFRFPFQFKLPLGSPSTFKGSKCHVVYQIKGLLEPSSGFKGRARELVTLHVVGHIDLSARVYQEFTPYIHEAMVLKPGKGLRVELPSIGLIPGSRAPFKIHVYKDKEFVWAKPKLVLRKKEWMTTSEGHASKVKTTDLVKVRKESGASKEKGLQAIWEGFLDLPADIPLTDLGGESLIKVNYEIKVTDDKSQFKTEFPVVIGSGFFGGDDDEVFQKNS